MRIDMTARTPAPLRAGRAAGAVAGVVLLAVACGSGSASGDTFIGGTYKQAVAYTDCMRSHGVPSFPEPDSQGNYSSAAINAVGYGQQERNAFEQCRSLLPNEGTGLSVTQLQTIMESNLQHALKAALCMREHGVPGFPEPTPMSSDSGVNWPQTLPAGIDQNSPQYTKAFRKCSGPDVGGPIPPMLAPGFVPPSPPTGGSGPGVTNTPAAG
jgi:hypothetical protein